MREPAWRTWLVPLSAAGAVLIGLGARMWRPELAPLIWYAALVICGAPVVARTTIGLLRARFAADVVAALAIVSAIVLQQPFAGLVIVLMQTGGELLERFAEGRASRAVRALEDAAPREAHVLRADGNTDDVAATDVAVGDLLLVRPGEMIPCNGVLAGGHSHLDESRLTGEALPRRVHPGSIVQSGAVNLESAINLRVSHVAASSLYARIVELVRVAQANKAPIQRLADRYAIWFTPATLLVCAMAWWSSGDPLRVLAVLVVATPCPLILAAPVAIIGGISRAAEAQIIVRTGGALERLAAVDTAVFDKTGTMTVGRPEVVRVTASPPWSDDEVMTFAAAVEHHSGHLLAATTMAEAVRRGIAHVEAYDVVEEAGSGVTGRVTGHTVSVGSSRYVAEHHPLAAQDIHRVQPGATGMRALVAIDGALAGTIDYADHLRANIGVLLGRLRAIGVKRVVIVSGDHADNVRAIGAAIGIEDARGDLLPADKVAIVNELMREGARVVMVGDGTNDAPALSASSVGIALGGHGGGVTAEAADVVLLTDDMIRVADAIVIARDTVRITRQSIVAGLVLSGVAMIVAAFGAIPPTAGALLQEAIDVAVILNALRAGRRFATMRPRRHASPDAVVRGAH